MLTITRDKDILTIQVDTGVGYLVSFRRQSENELNAILLKNQLEGQLEETIKEIKQNLYNKGFDDKTKRKTKNTWFSGNIKTKVA